MKNMTYEQAKNELEKILTALQEDALDLDKLHEYVRRAADLIAFCRDKLRTTEENLEKVLKEGEDLDTSW